MPYKPWHYKDLLQLLLTKCVLLPAQLSRRPHPTGTGAAGEGGRKERNIATLILCRGRLWVTWQCSREAGTKLWEATDHLKYPKFMEIRENFPNPEASIRGDTPGDSWVTRLALSTLNHIARAVFRVYTLRIVFIISRRKLPFDTSMTS